MERHSVIDIHRDVRLSMERLPRHTLKKEKRKKKRQALPTSAHSLTSPIRIPEKEHGEQTLNNAQLAGGWGHHPPPLVWRPIFHYYFSTNNKLVKHCDLSPSLDDPKQKYTIRTEINSVRSNCWHPIKALYLILEMNEQVAEQLVLYRHHITMAISQIVWP